MRMHNLAPKVSEETMRKFQEEGEDEEEGEGEGAGEKKGEKTD